MTENANDTSGLREQVRARYAQAATAVKAGTRNADLLVEDQCCGSSCCGGAPADRDETKRAEASCCESSCCGDTATERSFGAGLYDLADADGLPIEAIEASLGGGNPTAVAELREGERVLDLGSGGGIDVLLSAKRVGPSGFAYGVDMTDEMLELAEANKAKAEATNVEFLKGTIEDVPLPDGAVDVVISNCVINLSVDKPAVLAEMFRVLTPADGSESPMSSPKTTSLRQSGPSAAPTSAASPEPSPEANTSTASQQSGSPTPAWSSPTKPPTGCTPPSSAPSSPQPDPAAS